VKEIKREMIRGDKLAFNTARESGDFFTIFVMFFILFSDSNISFSKSHGIAEHGRAGQNRAEQGRFQHVPAPRHTPPRGENDDDRASEGREERRNGLIYLSATQRMHAFWWRLAFFLVMDAPEDMIG
jgi:hypothetical protein